MSDCFFTFHFTDPFKVNGEYVESTWAKGPYLEWVIDRVTSTYGRDFLWKVEFIDQDEEVCYGYTRLGVSFCYSCGHREPHVPLDCVMNRRSWMIRRVHGL